MIRTIFKELKNHAPYTLMGALIGILIAVLLKNISESLTFKLFYVFHPLHVLLGAFITTSMYKLHKKNPNIIKVFLVGFIGSIGVASLSDSILPFIGETILHFPHRELHLGFIEKWYIVNPIAILGVILATKKPFTKLPHSLHIFISTSASLLHVMMSISGVVINIALYFMIVFLLFLSVWLPCCFSDIVLPLLFASDEKIKHCSCCKL